MNIIILGAGPAGLTAAYLAAKHGHKPFVFEKEASVGGLARTFDYKGFLFDIGGHRFFSYSKDVLSLWHEILGDEFIRRPRLSRIRYRDRYFHYPLKPLNVLMNLNPLEALSVLSSSLRWRLFPPESETNFEEWMSKRFGKKMFEIFFKSYTEKVWGIPCTRLQADWAAQRIKSLTWSKLFFNAFGLLRNNQVATLTDQFHYPRRGPGQMWEEARRLIEKHGGCVFFNSEITQLMREGNGIAAVRFRTNGTEKEIKGEHFISSLSLRELIRNISPAPPEKVKKAAGGLRYRDFLTVGLIIDKPDIFPDNWIYIHTPDVRVSRIQNFKNWSRDMVPDPMLTSLGMEYFCFQSDDFWKSRDNDLIELAKEEVCRLQFAEKGQILDGVVIRAPHAYPLYDENYKTHIETIKSYLSSLSNLQVIGRNGLHRYNNQDHSMLTAICAFQNILGKEGSVWDINTENIHHEIKAADP